ncbi:MAG TPA: acetate--CoA ligase family protein [Thermodesulfobacteriota bacterium]|nr:acetate--CoA ligase family protein [Thermodesulfobacteriota bacterium]
MDTFFHPDSIAVIGASNRNIGNFVVGNLLLGFQGAVYPINPNYKEIEGLPCFSSLEDIPHPIDLAIVLVPASSVPSVLEACAVKGIRRVIIESAGFAETGEEGLALQDQCVAIGKQNGMRIWGPNCMGLVDIHRTHFFTFMHPGVREEGLLPGRISLIVQSGMMSAIFLAELGRRGIGIAKACSIGNRADVDECDILEYLLKDPDTEVIALYLESIPRGRLFAQIAGSSAKPIVLLKGGRSKAGALAAKSHTYSLSGNSRLLNSVLEMEGVTLADSIYQMMDLANTLALIPHVNPPCRTAVLSLSGGAGVLACDALESHGVPVAQLSEQTQKAVGEVFPVWMPVANPIDLFASVGLHGRDVVFDHTISAVLEDANTDVLLIHFVAGLDERILDLDALKKKADRSEKAVFFWLMGRREGCERFRQKARTLGIPVYDDVPRIAECLVAASRFRAHKLSLRTVHVNAVPPSPDFPEKPPFPSGEKIWDEFDSKKFLSGWGIPVVEERLVRSLSGAWKAARQMGLSVVLKGLMPGEVHKTEHGLVHLGIMDKTLLESAYHVVREKVGPRGRILIQKEVKADYELIAGFIRDNQFGPCVMFGLGGIFSELEPDVVFAMAPLDRQWALKLIGRIRGKRLLQGFREMAPLEKDTVVDILVRLGNAGIAYPRIEQIDINPLVVSKGIPLAVDANVILKE